MAILSSPICSEDSPELCEALQINKWSLQLCPLRCKPVCTAIPAYHPPLVCTGSQCSAPEDQIPMLSHNTCQGTENYSIMFSVAKETRMYREARLEQSNSTWKNPQIWFPSRKVSIEETKWGRTSKSTSSLNYRKLKKLRNLSEHGTAMIWP